MPYQAKTDWQHDTPVTENDLNRIEKGVSDAHVSIEQLSADVSNLKIRVTTMESILPENFLFNKFDDDLSPISSIRVIRGYYNEAQSRLEV